MPPLVLNHRKNLSGDGKKRKDGNKTELSDGEREKNVIKIVLFLSLLPPLVRDGIFDNNLIQTF
jgi:hypothetical protein